MASHSNPFSAGHTNWEKIAFERPTSSFEWVAVHMNGERFRNADARARAQSNRIVSVSVLASRNL